jgi:hypothetical protein
MKKGDFGRPFLWPRFGPSRKGRRLGRVCRQKRSQGLPERFQDKERVMEGMASVKPLSRPCNIVMGDKDVVI